MMVTNGTIIDFDRSAVVGGQLNKNVNVASINRRLLYNCLLTSAWCQCGITVPACSVPNKSVVYTRKEAKQRLTVTTKAVHPLEIKCTK